LQLFLETLTFWKNKIWFLCILVGKKRFSRSSVFQINFLIVWNDFIESHVAFVLLGSETELLISGFTSIGGLYFLLDKNCVRHYLFLKVAIFSTKALFSIGIDVFCLDELCQVHFKLNFVSDISCWYQFYIKCSFQKLCRKFPTFCDFRPDFLVYIPSNRLFYADFD